MDQASLLSLFSKLRIWTNGEQRAPHKPLLVLYVLGRLLRGEVVPIPYKEVDQDLRKLLQEFGPRRKTFHPELPFWHLQSDGIWNLIENGKILKSEGQLSRRLLLDREIKGEFSKPVLNAIQEHPSWGLEVIGMLLESHFPRTLHEDLLLAVGIHNELPEGISVLQKKSYGRNPEFRGRVLRAYGYACSVCGFSVRLGNTPVGLEAAHIRWHQAGGPDIEGNGMALCSLHHKLFDRGAFTLDSSFRVIVSDDVNGVGAEQVLWAYHQKNLNIPRQEKLYPYPDYVDWHVREVFHGN